MLGSLRKSAVRGGKSVLDSGAVLVRRHPRITGAVAALALPIVAMADGATNPLDTTLQATGLGTTVLGIITPYISAWIPITVGFVVVGYFVNKVTRKSSHTA